MSCIRFPGLYIPCDTRRFSAAESFLQRLFSAFPGGPPGIGLLILRMAVGATLLAQGILCLPWYAPASASVVVAVVLISTGGCILVGFLTPVLGILAGIECLGLASLWFPLPSGSLLDCKPFILHLIATATAISLLGPGAYSLDARLFGWREIVIPPAVHKPDDHL